MASQHDQLNPLARHLVDSKQGFICPVCLQKFTADATIASHWAGHVEKESAHFACKLCALEFNNVKALTAHLSSSRHREMKVRISLYFVILDIKKEKGEKVRKIEIKKRNRNKQIKKENLRFFFFLSALFFLFLKYRRCHDLY